MDLLIQTTRRNVLYLFAGMAIGDVVVHRKIYISVDIKCRLGSAGEHAGWNYEELQLLNLL